MANICEYKVIVKGKKNACYAFFGSMSCMDYKEIDFEKGTDDKYEMHFSGDCKWSVDAYCGPYEGNVPVELPENYEEAFEAGQDLYWYKTVQDRSAMFAVEVLCNSADIDDFDPSEGPDEIYEHYRSGKTCRDSYGEAPEELKIHGWWDE